MIRSQDLLIRARTKAMLIGDPDIGALDVSADVEDGVVTLTGQVETEDQRETAEELARGVPGVKAVRNQLQVVAEEVEDLIEG